MVMNRISHTPTPSQFVLYRETELRLLAETERPETNEDENNWTVINPNSIV